MTNLEIDKALALAIGWTANDMRFYVDGKFGLRDNSLDEVHQYRLFSHLDWNVIGPIAERYNVFPYQWQDGRWGAPRFTIMHYADTPQKAIALAVIQGAKK